MILFLLFISFLFVITLEIIFKYFINTMGLMKSINQKLYISLNYYNSYMNINQLKPILTNKEIEVVRKRLNNKHITQTESNYLSRSIRPKLRSAELAASNDLLSLLEYRRKKYERKDSVLKNKIIKAVKDIDIKAIILFGSYIRNNHTNYRDVDVMVVLKQKLWKTSAEKNRLEKEIEKKINIKTDINLIIQRELETVMAYSPLLQTELEDYKILYGDIKLNKQIIIDKTYLYKKLLEVEYVLELKNIKPRYIYNAIRNCLSIELFLKKKVDNKLIIRTIEKNIGKKTAESLLDDKSNKMQKDISLKYLKYLYKKLIKILR